MSQGDSDLSDTIQALAPVASEGLALSRRLAEFVARVIGQPTDVASDMVADTLRYRQWERLGRFLDRAMEFNKQRQRQGKPRLLLPKFLLPIIENASLEEDDDLQDLWANLFSTGTDPERPALRMAFIDIVKQLEKVDALILRLMLESSDRGGTDPAVLGVESRYIAECLALSERECRVAIDNLIRLRCVTSFVEQRDLDIPRPVSIGTETEYEHYAEPITYDHGYDHVRLTELGLALIEACTAPRRQTEAG